MIKIDADIKERKKAKFAHELFTINTILVHLFLPVAMLKFGNPKLAISIPILISISIIIWTFFKVKKSKKTDSYLVFIHWQSSLNNYKFLIGTYVFYFLLTFIGMLIGQNERVGMDGVSLIDTITLRLSVIPLFIAVLVSTVIGSGSMFNAGRGEISKKMAKKYPQ